MIYKKYTATRRMDLEQFMNAAEIFGFNYEIEAEHDGDAHNWVIILEIQE